ncbi:MAG: D-aminoacylase, partial [Prolixibacteraceae bacterium]|nr:D-aminoacylase [Prolixibacteraceae bacterium]
MNTRPFIKYLSLILIALLIWQCNKDEFDIVVINGTVYDGTGSQPVITDIGISNGIITEIGKNLSKKNATVIDADGLVVSPGFIDIHTHCDGQVLRQGMNEVKNYLLQGVTTVVTGNCGGGTYKVDKFYSKLDSIGTGINIVHLVGHNTIRREVMGMENREATPEEIEEMKKRLKTGLEEGAAGMSTGLFYTPGAYAPTSEIVELAKVVKEYGRFYASHLRDESNYNIGLEEAVKEAITVGEKTGVRVQISHIKALGKPVWGMSPKICSLIEEAKKRGVHIFADQYPYNASNTGLSAATVSSWVVAGGQLKNRLQDPELLPGIKKEMTENIDRRGGPESLVIVSYPKDHRFDGKNLAEISEMINKTAVETAIQLILDGSPSVVSFNMQDSDIKNFMQKDYVMTGSDGSIVIPGNDKPHPRSYGAFTRKIRKYVLDEKVISMEHAIRAATSMPADMTGLKDRGRLKEGNVADIVIFNPETINDPATYNKPHQYSQGIEYLLVNGDVV